MFLDDFEVLALLSTELTSVDHQDAHHAPIATITHQKTIFFKFFTIFFQLTLGKISEILLCVASEILEILDNTLDSKESKVFFKSIDLEKFSFNFLKDGNFIF